MEENKTVITDIKDAKSKEAAVREEPAAEESFADGDRKEKNRKSAGRAGCFLAGAAAAVIVIVLIMGYIQIPLGRYGSVTVKLPYYNELHGADNGKIDRVELSRKLDEVENYLNSTYLYEMDSKTIIDGIMTGLVYGLSEDNYAAYYSREDFENETKLMNGSYVGIGVAIVKDPETGGLRVESLSIDGPAMESGIEIGDIILKADGEDLSGLEISECVSRLTGEEGTTVLLEIKRRKSSFELTVERRTISDRTVHTEMIEDTGIGYISITGFINITEEEFYSAIDELVEDKEAQGLIIDLRNNGGGDMNVALRMVDSILPDDIRLPEEAPEGASGNASENEPEKEPSGNGNAASGVSDKQQQKQAAEGPGETGKNGGALLLSVEDKNGKAMKFYAEDTWEVRVPVVVLVNERSASASEIFAGILLSYGYDVVGTKTFGKGIVQSLYTLSDKSAIKFTTDQYRLPNGELIHGVGIEPTAAVEFEEFEDETFEEKVTSKQVNYAAGKRTELTEDTQLNAALQLIRSAIEEK